MKSWFYHNVYCSHPEEAEVYENSEWESWFFCSQCMQTPHHEDWFWKSWGNFIKRFNMVIFPLTDEEDLPF